MKSTKKIRYLWNIFSKNIEVWRLWPVKSSIILIVLAFALCGSYLVYKSFALVPGASIEIENGSLSGDATIGSDTTASGGKYVQFGTAGKRPDAGGYFQLAAADTSATRYPLSDSSCAGQVHHSTWEPRTDNGAANQMIPAGLNLTGNPDFNSTWNSKYLPKVTGNYTGTTDEIIQWASCKWGWSDELVRAEAVDESQWHMSAAGDWTTTFTDCPTDTATTVKNGVLGCYQSYGLLQNKWKFNKSEYPMYRTMTAFHLDYSLAKLRGCYDGLKYVGGATHAGDLWGCVGNWFSGNWYDSGATDYINVVEGYYCKSGQTTDTWPNCNTDAKQWLKW
jgi:hypothetical protein